MADSKPKRGGGRPRKPLEDYYRLDPLTGCWIWLGCRQRSSVKGNKKRRGTGYGKVFWDGKTQLIHVWAFRKFIRELAPWEEVHHKEFCSSPLCFNPEHLEAVDCDYHTYITALHSKRKRKFAKDGPPPLKIWTELEPILVDGYRGIVVSVNEATLQVLLEQDQEVIEIEVDHPGLRKAA